MPVHGCDASSLDTRNPGPCGGGVARNPGDIGPRCWRILFDKLGKPGIWKIFAFEPILSLLIFTSALLAWLVVAAEPGGRTRWGMLVAASVVSAALTAAITMPIASAVGIDQVWQALMEKKKPMPPDVAAVHRNTVHLSTLRSVFCSSRRRRILRQRLRRRSGRSCRRSARRPPLHAKFLKSRLTAMQAQVEPQFLFDSLVDIETLVSQECTRRRRMILIA